VQKRTGRIQAAFYGFCSRTIAALLLLFMCYLLPMSFFRTTGMSTGTGKGEVISFNYDNFCLNRILLFISVCLIYLLWRHFESISLNRLLSVLCVWVLAFGLVFVLNTKLQPSEDSYIVNFFARQAARGDFSYYHEYFKFYPFQLGYVLYAEAFFRLFNLVLPGVPEGFGSLALQGMNVIYTAFAYCALVKFSGYVFKSETVQKLSALLMFFCMPPLFFATFMYGNVPALAFICAGLWLYAAFLEKGRWYNGLGAALALTAAVILKLNSLIVVLAVFIAVFVSFVKKPRWSLALFAAVFALVLLLVMPLPQKLYEARMDEKLGDGIPQVSWLAMGLHEGSSCSGWYSPTYTTTAYRLTEYDPDATAFISEKAIQERLDAFRQYPIECYRFFGRKFLSQWNEPTYQGLWNNQLRDHYSQPGFVYQLLCHDWERPVKAFMNIYQQLIFFGFALGLVRIFRRRDMSASLLPLIILGAMLYHLLFEAKSQHSQGYFIMMIPVAAFGFARWFEYLRDNKPR